MHAAPAAEFVEIHGPAGLLPPGLELRFYGAATGAVAASIALVGSIANDAAGFGLLVLGDPGVADVDLSAGFGAGSDDNPDLDPSAVQLLDATTGAVYDSLVYEAFGGLDELMRRETFGVTDEGRPWLGEIATGTDASGEA